MIGDNIKKYRELKRMDAKTLANIVDITPAYLSLIENNKRKNVSIDVLGKIASALGVSVNDFFIEEDLKNVKVAPQPIEEPIEEEPHPKEWYKKYRELSDKDKKFIDNVMDDFIARCEEETGDY